MVFLRTKGQRNKLGPAAFFSHPFRKLVRGVDMLPGRRAEELSAGIGRYPQAKRVALDVHKFINRD